MLRLLSGLICIACFLTTPWAWAQEVVEKTFCMSAITYTSSPDDLKRDLLVQVQRLAVNELFGELIVSSSQVKDFALTDDMINAYSSGYVRVRGNPIYQNGPSFGEVCVTAELYATAEDRKKLQPVRISKKKCYANPNLTARELKDATVESAITSALLQYEPRLEGIPGGVLAKLVREVRFAESGFIPESETYCVKFEGLIFPIEIVSLVHRKDAYIPPEPLVDTLPDQALTASSMWANDLTGHGPPNAKFSKTSTYSNWSAATNDPNQWIQVDLGSNYLIRAVGTKGRHANYGQWVTSYKLLTSLDGVTWTCYRQQDVDVVFPGNTDTNTEVRHQLVTPMVARYVRFQPVAWHSHITMRVEVYGVPRQ